MTVQSSPNLCCLINPYGKLCWECTLRKRKSYAYFKYKTMIETHTYESLMALWAKHDSDWKWRSKKKASNSKESVLLLCRDLGLEPKVQP